MSRKSKGISAERELLHMFWSVGFVALRAPGSGTIRYPCPDLLAGTLTRKLAIECKATKAQRVYISAEQIGNLRKFGSIFGAECWVGVRFDNMNWHFISLEDLVTTGGGNHVISQDYAKMRGLLFEEFMSYPHQSSLVNFEDLPKADAETKRENNVCAKPSKLPTEEI